MRKHTSIALAAALAVTVAACSSTGGGNLKPAVQDMIDTLESNRDCSSLQFQFDRYDDLGGKADELKAIDGALRRAGCYD